ncbi:MAG: leucine-rich repeat protein, partial [Eubacterium sp.]
MKTKAFKKAAVILLSAAMLLCFMPFSFLQPAVAQDQENSNGTGETAKQAEAATGTSSASSGTYSFKTMEDGTAVITGYKGNEENLTIPDTVTKDGKEYRVTDIGSSFSVPNTVKSINTGNVTKVSRIVVGYYWQGQLESVTMPEVTELGKNTFHGCTSLTTVIAPKLEKVGDGAFQGCSELKT